MEKLSDSTQVVRRVEVTVERRSSRIEVHGSLQFPAGWRCPECGADLEGREITVSQDENTRQGEKGASR